MRRSFGIQARVVLVAALAVCSLNPALTQSAADYAAMLALYATSPDQAVASLAVWPEPIVRTAVAACAPEDKGTSVCTPIRRRVAAVLHADAASRVVAAQVAHASFHVDMGRRLLGKADAAPAFVARWYNFAARLFLLEGRLLQAGDLAEDGLRQFRDSPELFLTRGIVSEIRMSSAYRDPRGHALGREPTSLAHRQLLDTAIIDYRHALEAQPLFASARVRLGWALLLARDTRAGAEFSAALRDAAPADQASRYLAHLFLGSLAEDRGNLEDALTAYEAARREAPAGQTACLAASRVESALGHDERARRLALHCLTLAQRSDPWWSHQFGAPPADLLPWLRQEARRP
jgi:hypothetical protein